MGEHFNGQEDHKAFRREEFEGKLRDMGLELEKDEDVSLHTICVCVLFAKVTHVNVKNAGRGTQRGAF